MKRKLVAVWLLISFLGMLLSACSAHMHKVGSGAAGTDVVTKTQWYILWGLVPLNSADTATMSAGSTNYDIKTEITVLDFVMNMFTGFVTVYSRTVTVKK